MSQENRLKTAAACPRFGTDIRSSGNGQPWRQRPPCAAALHAPDDPARRGGGLSLRWRYCMIRAYSHGCWWRRRIASPESAFIAKQRPRTRRRLRATAFACVALETPYPLASGKVNDLTLGRFPYRRIALPPGGPFNHVECQSGPGQDLGGIRILVRKLRNMPPALPACSSSLRIARQPRLVRLHLKAL